MPVPCRAYAPIEPSEGHVSSRYGLRPGRTTGRIRHHAGLDIMASRGTAVLAIKAGTVEQVISTDERGRGFDGYGNAVVLGHGDGYRSFYAHLDRVVVSPGDVVLAGMILGQVGNSSNGKFPGMGVHLHLEVRRSRADGSSPFPGPYGVFNVDPEDYLRERGVVVARRRFIVTREACESEALALRGLSGLRGEPSFGNLVRQVLGQDLGEYEPPIAGFGLWSLVIESKPIIYTGIALSALALGATGWLVFRAVR